MKKKPSPKTKREWAAYRCKLSCKIGREVLDSKPVGTPQNFTSLEYAIFNLLHAVEELANVITSDDHKRKTD